MNNKIYHHFERLVYCFRKPAELSRVRVVTRTVDWIEQYIIMYIVQGFTAQSSVIYLCNKYQQILQGIIIQVISFLPPKDRGQEYRIYLSFLSYLHQ